MRADPAVALLAARDECGARRLRPAQARDGRGVEAEAAVADQADLGVEGLEAAVGEAEADGGGDAVALGASIRAALPGSGSRGHDAPVRSCLHRSSDTHGRAADCAAAAPGP